MTPTIKLGGPRPRRTQSRSHRCAACSGLPMREAIHNGESDVFGDPAQQRRRVVTVAMQWNPQRIPQSARCRDRARSQRNRFASGASGRSGIITAAGFRRKLHRPRCRVERPKPVLRALSARAPRSASPCSASTVRWHLPQVRDCSNRVTSSKRIATPYAASRSSTPHPKRLPIRLWGLHALKQEACLRGVTAHRGPASCPALPVLLLEQACSPPCAGCKFKAFAAPP